MRTPIKTGARRMAIEDVPVHTNLETRPSRPMPGIPRYITKPSGTKTVGANPNADPTYLTARAPK